MLLDFLLSAVAGSSSSFGLVSGGWTSAFEEAELVEDQDQDKFAHSDGKGRVGKSNKLLGVALAAESTRTHEEACKDAEVEKVKDDKSDGSKPG